MRKRGRIKKQLQKTRSATKKQKLQSKLSTIERELLKSYHSDRCEEEARAVDAIKRNPKYFYSYAKKFSKTSCGIGPLSDKNGNLSSNPPKMAELLSEQYSSVYSEPKMDARSISTIFEDGGVETSQHSFTDFVFDESDIAKAIDELTVNAAAGPDGFPAIFLKKCKKQLAKPLYLLWRESLDSGIIPSDLKRANIIPIHKGGVEAFPRTTDQ